MPWSEHVLREWIGPEIHIKPGGDLPDLREEFPDCAYWPEHYFMSSVLNGAFAGQIRFYAANVVFRGHATFHAYHHARAATLEYVNRWRPGEPDINWYFTAVSAWERMFQDGLIAYDLIRKMTASDLRGDKDRFRLMGNRIKHVAEDVQYGKTKPPGLPLWFTGAGLATHEHELTFEQISEQIRWLGRLVDGFSQPNLAAERLADLEWDLKERDKASHRPKAKRRS